ncbi:hypothetical protein PG993_012645 [Apiospora rasikravindrae]|uniref:Uncharacterized protein n=1 Tax=Apiospora rasikravindrae TaxID=990691 RepID=A0ABR1S310_9PEZI
MQVYDQGGRRLNVGRLAKISAHDSGAWRGKEEDDGSGQRDKAQGDVITHAEREEAGGERGPAHEASLGSPLQRRAATVGDR